MRRDRHVRSPLWYGVWDMVLAGAVECRLESASDLATLLNALTLRDKEQKDQRVICEASENGLKFTAQSAGKDVTVLGWIFKDAFTEYTFDGAGEEHLHFKLPVAPLLSCLNIFSERAVLAMRFPAGAHELRFTLEEDGATTECRLRTLLLDEAPVPIATFRAENERLSIFRAKQPEIWHAALSEFHELEAPDVVLKVTFRPATAPDAPIVTLRASTIGSDAEVELSQSSLEDVELAEHAAVAGQITHSYLLSSVLGGCLKAAKESRGLKVRFNQEGVMSNQFILKSRRRQLLCEALICPMAEAAGIKTSAMGGMGANMQSIPAEESIGF